MKINIAIYTAQEGYSWQPGTVITPQELKDYKACIGKFPSPDAEGFPFGGVFLKDDKVVFYRYHVAKKIDFRGRDALYCVLGALPKAEAFQVDPNALFALPEFAGVVKPFPTQAEVQPAPSESVPEWLKNLDAMSLDVRITGSQDDLKFAVKQEPTKVPEPQKIEKPVVVPQSEPPKVDGPKQEAVGEVPLKPSDGPLSSVGANLPKPLPWYKDRFVIVSGILLLLAISVLTALVLFAVSIIRGSGSDRSENPQTNVQAVAEQRIADVVKLTNEVEQVGKTVVATNKPAAADTKAIETPKPASAAKTRGDARAAK